MTYHFKDSRDSSTVIDGTYYNGSNMDIIPDDVVPTTEVVSLAPLVVGERYTAHALVPLAAPDGHMNTTPFTMSGTRYIPLAGNLCIKMD